MVMICLAGVGESVIKTIICNVELETLKCLLWWSLGAVAKKGFRPASASDSGVTDAVRGAPACVLHIHQATSIF